MTTENNLIKNTFNKLGMLLLAGGLVFTTACSDDDDGVTTPDEPTGTLTVMENQFVAENNNSLMISTVNLSQNGWIVVHEDNNGAPGAVVGVSDLITSGPKTSVMVNFNDDYTPMFGDGYHLMLHRDNGVQGTYEFTGQGSPDQPIVSGTTPVMKMVTFNFPTGATPTEYALMEAEVAGISGTAKFYDGADEATYVILELTGTPEGGVHPAHIHANAVDEVPNPPIEISLNSVDGTTGMSVTRVTEKDNEEAVTYEELLAYDGHINVHLSPEDLATYVAQGNIGANATE